MVQRLIICVWLHMWLPGGAKKDLFTYILACSVAQCLSVYLSAILVASVARCHRDLSVYAVR